MGKLKRLISTAMVVCVCTVPLYASAKEENSLTESEIMEIADEIGGRYNICPEFLASIAFYESSYQPGAKNGDCEGLMQVNPKWHEDRMEKLGVTDLWDPKQNMDVAANYLNELFEEYEDSGTVLMVYGGYSNWEEYENLGEMPEYVTKILSKSAEMERRNGK